jgi:hypothetical protein
MVVSRRDELDGTIKHRGFLTRNTALCHDLAIVVYVTRASVNTTTSRINSRVDIA